MRRVPSAFCLRNIVQKDCLGSYLVGLITFLKWFVNFRLTNSAFIYTEFILLWDPVLISCGSKFNKLAFHSVPGPRSLRLSGFISDIFFMLLARKHCILHNNNCLMFSMQHSKLLTCRVSMLVSSLSVVFSSNPTFVFLGEGDFKFFFFSPWFRHRFWEGKDLL